MLTHDSRFEELAKAPVKQTDVEVVKQDLDAYGYLDSTPYWTSSDLLMEVKIDAVGEMLGAVTKKATVKLIGIQNDVAVGDVFQIRLGLYDQDPSVSGFNYISQGFFIVDEIDYDYDSGFTSVTMYDHMWRANKLIYNETIPPETFTYPITVEQLALEVANVLNVELMVGFSSLPNADYLIQEDLYTTISAATLQNVIQHIAGATGTTARITDTTLNFSVYDVSTENLTSDELKKLKIGDTYGPVNSVILGRVPQNDNIALYAQNPNEFIVESVDDTNNLLTITAHGMPDGNMVYFSTDGTLPAPLSADTPYYVYTNTATDTFALAPTYNDAIAGTNLIDLTDQGSGTMAIDNIVTKEIQINNNEILDDDRQTLLPPLYNALTGIDWSYVKADTVGLAWHEVGDVIQFTQGLTTVRAFISEIHLIFDGGVKENLFSDVPKVAAIDYKAAGGITKSIYNTEIKVDKQAQDITSVVSRQDTFEGETLDNFTQVYQDIDNIELTVQKAGGGNLLLNSVGYARESYQDTNNEQYDKLLFWDYNDPYTVAAHGTVTSYTSSESQNYGGISGQVVEMEGTDVLMTQRIDVAVNTPMSFGLRVKNILAQGTATITLENDYDSYTINIDDSVDHIWEEYSLVNFTSTMPWMRVTIQVNNALKFMFTDLRLLYGTTLTGWVQANSEILSANVQFTKDGMRIFDSVHDTETRVTFNEFSTRRKTDGEILFEADDIGVMTNNLTIKGGTNYVRDDETIIKQITIGSANPKAGLAFIKVLEDL